MTRRRSGWLGLVAAAAAALTLTSCIGVPGSSSPRVVRALPQAPQAAASPIVPHPGDEPQTILRGFLANNVSTADDKHNAAKQFLTAEARSKWSDSSVTVVDSFQYSAFDETTKQIVLTGHKIGTLNASGIYAPVLQGDGTGSEPLSITFTLSAEADGQWRIDSLPPGLLVQASQFSNEYRQRKLYYFDLSGQHLVADPRYSPLTEQSLASWLLTQLLAGPRAELVNAVLALPDQINAKTATVVDDKGSTTVAVELPGSSSLDDPARQRLAAQLAAIFGQPGLISSVTMTDGGKPVQIQGKSAPYSLAQFAAQTGADYTDPPLYYLNEYGDIMNDDGTPVPGPLGQGRNGLAAIGLARSSPTDTTAPARVAATSGPADKRTLSLGTLTQGLTESGVRSGAMTRPVWAPNQSAAEVWVGVGAALFRVPAADPSAPDLVQISLRSGPLKQIVALRFSPDGVRLALVAIGSDSTAEAYVGTVERAAKTVRIDNLVPVSPSDVNINDVGWNDDSTLYLVGSEGTGPGVWSVWSDGAQWTARSHNNLYSPPTAIAASPLQYTWVESNKAVYRQRLPDWESPNPRESVVHGSSPTYLQ